MDWGLIRETLAVVASIFGVLTVLITIRPRLIRPRAKPNFIVSDLHVSDIDGPLEG